MIFKPFFYKIEIEIFGNIVHEDFANFDDELFELRQYYVSEYEGHDVSISLCRSVKKSTRKLQ